MAIKATDIHRILIERIEASHPTPALFSATETDEWPTEALNALLNCGVLQPANRAESTWCTGCEWQCHKTIVVRTRVSSSQTEALITCNEEPDLGRITVPMRNLDQYRTTLAAVSKFIAGQMAFGDPRPSAAGAAFLLGTTRGRGGPCEVTISVDTGRLLLGVRGEREPLVRVLLLDGARLSIDKSVIRRLANRKGTASSSRVSRPPDHLKRHDRVRRTRVRHRAIFAEAKKRRTAGQGTWTTIASCIARTDLALVENGRRLSPASVRRIVTEMSRRERESSRSK
jgi:hypothetical protein